MRTLLALVFLICIGQSPLYSQFVSQETVLEDGQGSGLKNNRSVPDGHGGYYLAGHQDNGRGLLLHLDSSFAILASKLYSGGAWPNVFPDMIFDDVELLSAGQLILAGQVTDTVTGKVNALLMKCDSSGAVLWARQLNGTGLYSRFVAVSVCNDGGFICTGNLFSPITTQPGQLLVTRTDSAGQVLWSKAFTGLNHENAGREVLALPDGGFLLTGFTENLNPYEGSTSLMKLDSSGTVVQSIRIQISGVIGFLFCGGSDLVNTAQGPVLYMITSSGVAIARIDSAFQTLQVSSFSGNAWGGFSPTTYPGFHLLPTSDGGGVFTSRSGFYSDMGKIDSVGNLEWSRMALLQLNDVFVQNDGAMVLIGEGPLFGVISPPDPLRQSSFLPQIGIQRTDSLALSGNCVQPGMITVDPMNPSYAIAPYTVTGMAAGTLQPVSITTSTASVLSRSGCVDILGGNEELSTKPSLRISPNPASEKFTIDHDLKGDVRIALSDIHGRNLMVRPCFPMEGAYVMDAPRPGVYIITVENGKQRVTGRLVVVK